MNAQNSTPMTPSSVKRAPRPRSPAMVRARAVSHFGSRTKLSDGSGRRSSLTEAFASGIQHLDQLARRILAREAQEDLLEPLLATRCRRAQLRHGTARPDGSTCDDRHAIAHG